MTDIQLRDALAEVQKHILSQLPTEYLEHEFSPRFHRKLKRLVELEKHPILFYVRKAVAFFFITLGITGGFIVGFDEEVRADIVRWIVVRFSDNEYRYQKDEAINVDITRYSVEGIVSGEYHLIDRFEGEDTVNEAFADEKGNLLIFTAMSSTHEEDFYILFAQRVDSETVYVKGNKAELYLSKDPNESNMIVWQGTSGVLFGIQGFFDKDQLIEMAEKVE
ncbi:MAG: DUF4367 domain-containing protein [Lachnospiraceae bacterium]|nr:DUF4367 domain-containing protein [Lachnospiraceae bacterium]